MTDAPSAPERPGAAPPPDPDEYDTERAQLARARGLAAPYIPGGRDPDPGPGIEEDRHYTRLLLYMVGAIIAAGFVLGIIANLMTGTSGS
jgi:hypothetical protein